MNAVRTRAPGRVNLIGEHTDYNDGFVLPCAIPNHTSVSARARDDGAVLVRSAPREAARFDVDALPAERAGSWSDYALGILCELRDAGVGLRGADLEVTGTVPLGAGLSSSASFELAVARAMLALCHARMEPRELAALAQRAESQYAGTRCGIMDQLAVLCAREGHAMLIDTRTLEVRHIPVPHGAAVLVCNTMVKHELAASAYNRRREECERSVELLRGRFPDVRALRDLCAADLELAKTLLPAELFARARHVVTENARVMQAAQALEEDDPATVGRLMYASHESLRADYGVSCAELDAMVEAARAFEGTIGARMTGGGFGGCTVNLVRADRADEFRRYVARAYRDRTGVTPEIYDGTPSAGASVLDG